MSQREPFHVVTEMDQLTRRELVRIGAAVAGTLSAGFVVGCKTGGSPATAALRDTTIPTAAAQELGPKVGAYLHFAPDDRITLIVCRTESGQGVAHGLAMLTGEELGVDPAEIEIEYAGVNDKLESMSELDLGATGGSSAIRGYYVPMRKAAAAARELLIQAAAETWSVPAAGLKVEGKKIVNAAGTQSLGFGALATKASTLAVPQNPALKPASAFKYVGKSVPRRDVQSKTTGAARYGIDVVVPGMVNATIVHCPFVGGKLKTLDDAAAKLEKGVIAVVQTPYGVAVVADTFWHALSGAKKLVITWDAGANATLSSDSILAAQKTVVEASGKFQAAKKGNFATAFGAAPKKLTSYYHVPFLPHSTLEPQNCTAWVKDDGSVELWAPTQDPNSAADVAAAVAGVDAKKVQVHVTQAGGAFGRRLRQDYVAEAVHIAKAVKKPVKLLWTRPEEFIRDFYRPSTYNKLEGGVSATGELTCWKHHIVGPSIWAWLAEAPVIVPEILDALDTSSSEGADKLPYGIPNLLVEYTQHEPGVPVSWWRAVGHSQNAFMVECFLDELAKEAGKDPLAFRLGLTTNARLKKALSLAAETASWGSAVPAGSGRGIAVAESFGTIVAQVADVRVTGTTIKVEKITCAVDCGVAINPALVKAQIESAVIQALSACLLQKITIVGGAVQQKTFGACGLLPLADTPKIEVHLIPSQASPGGLGEPGVPPLAPAVANAIFAATGKRLRQMPFAL